MMNYETEQSGIQELSFISAKEQHKATFEKEDLKRFKLIRSDLHYTNLALLISDQCPYTIKVAAFQSKDDTISRKGKEFTGSVLKQMHDVLDYLGIFNLMWSTVEGLYRNEVRDYPESVIRDALLNLIIQRNYSLSASALIRIYSDRIEFVSLGGPERGDISSSRNPELANVFSHLKLIEVHDDGMSKIMKAYEECEEKPLIETTKNAFRITIPNRNAKRINDYEIRTREEQLSLSHRVL